MIKFLLTIFLCILFFISCIILSTAYTGKKLAVKPDDIKYYETLSTVGIVLFILDIIGIVVFVCYYYYYIDSDNIINSPKKSINKKEFEPVLNDIYKIKLAKKLLNAVHTKKNPLEICDKLINQSTDSILIEQFNKMKTDRSEYELINLCQNYSKAILGKDYVHKTNSV